MNHHEQMRPGDIVEVVNGQVAKRTDDAQQVLVLSSNPLLIGNSLGAEHDDREGFEVVALIGQVPVRVVGPC